MPGIEEDGEFKAEIEVKYRSNLSVVRILTKSTTKKSPSYSIPGTKDERADSYYSSPLLHRNPIILRHPHRNLIAEQSPLPLSEHIKKSHEMTELATDEIDIVSQAGHPHYSQNANKRIGGIRIDKRIQFSLGETLLGLIGTDVTFNQNVGNLGVVTAPFVDGLKKMKRVNRLYHRNIGKDHLSLLVWRCPMKCH